MIKILFSLFFIYVGYDFFISLDNYFKRFEIIERECYLKHFEDGCYLVSGDDVYFNENLNRCLLYQDEKFISCWSLRDNMSKLFIFQDEILELISDHYSNNLLNIFNNFCALIYLYLFKRVYVVKQKIFL